MYLIFNINLNSNQRRELENFQCQERHFVKISNNFVKEHIHPVTQEATPARRNSRRAGTALAVKECAIEGSMKG